MPRLLVAPAVVSITPSGIDLTVVVSGEVGASVAFVASAVVVVVVVEIVVVAAEVVETVVGMVVGADVVDEEVVTAGGESVVFDIWDPSVGFV